MEVQYSKILPSRYFIIIDGTYELSTDDLDLVVRIIKGSDLEYVQLLDIQERKWIDAEKLMKNQK